MYHKLKALVLHYLPSIGLVGIGYLTSFGLEIVIENYAVRIAIAGCILLVTLISVFVRDLELRR
jgi:hypothetical protein